MKFRYLVIPLFILSGTGTVSAQWNEYSLHGRGTVRRNSPLVANYEDSLRIFKNHLDTITGLHADYQPFRNISLSRIFLPLTFYRDIPENALSFGKNPRSPFEDEIDKALMNIYLNRPDLVVNTAADLSRLGPVVDGKNALTNQAPEIVEKVAPIPVEPTVVPMDLVVKKPNFWTFSGDYFLQFLQNYVSGNWYKGGESNFSMVGSAVLQANYNNKQKVKWDNKIELKLGYQTSRGDTLHRYKTSEDLIRYTSKLGLQATKRWYYTIQMIANTQFTHAFKSNDPKVYSDFLSPLNVNFSVGMDYDVEWLKKRLTGTIHIAPFAYNLKYVKRLELSTRYGLDEGTHMLNDFGSQFDVDLVWKFTDNIKWKTRLYGYTTYKRSELEWENTFMFQFNKYISTNIFVYPRFDDGANKDDHHGFWQLKEYASVGFSYSF